MKPHAVADDGWGRREWREAFSDRITSPMPPLPGEDVDMCVPIHCSECLKRIPTDEVASPDGEDYVRHFCGLNCLRRWETRHAQFTRE